MLKLARESANLSQTELAKKLKITPQFVCNWERNASNPPIKLLPKLARILELDVQSLIFNYFEDMKAYTFRRLKVKRTELVFNGPIYYSPIEIDDNTRQILLNTKEADVINMLRDSTLLDKEILHKPVGD